MGRAKGGGFGGRVGRGGMKFSALTRLYVYSICTCAYIKQITDITFILFFFG